MNYWACRQCSYVFQMENPPQTCPSCGASGTFRDVNCYIPECGGPDNIDYGLLGQKLSEERPEE